MITLCDHFGLHDICVPGQHRRQPLAPEEDRLREIIAHLRVEKGFSQRELSAKLGMHPMTIGKIERGERALAVIELIRIAELLGTIPDQLLAQVRIEH